MCIALATERNTTECLTHENAQICITSKGAVYTRVLHHSQVPYY
jgi:hypothetical protein